MIFNQIQIVEGEFQKDEMIIGYKVVWIRNVPQNTVQLDELEEVWVLDSENEEIKGYYDNHRDEIDGFVIADAYKHKPDEWERPSCEEMLEVRAEEAYEAMQIEKHFA